ncbi:YDG domain-containing protein [Dyella kyungheensis]|uniref:YDG domain-containing protein n=1 Tax=Dyella kyungheensis TaxID=1242174 RepID=UPI003CF14CA0
MNHIYRLCWNRTLKAWVPASELANNSEGGARRHAIGPRVLMLSLLSVALGTTGLAQAANAPGGGQVISGSGQIQQSGNVTTIQQNSQMLSLNWQNFDIGSGQTVNFVQPGASSIAVNRILGNTASEIDGHLNANGQVWLINPNGVLFGQNAQVNVGGIVASTLDLDDSTAGSGTVRFAGNGRGKVVNQGSITAAPGGYVALIGNDVSNQGVIRAQLGTVALAGGTAVTLTFKDNHLMHLVVDENTVQSLVENRQLIVADGGNVLMTAGACASLVASVVNNTGTVQAHSVQDHDGTITLLGGMEAGTVQVGGTIDASAPQGGDGGKIETSAAHFQLAGDANITAVAPQGKAGTWLVDPADLTIDSAAANAISMSLNGGTSVTETTSGSDQSAGNGDINVNAAINWNNAAATLELDAFRNINVNAAVSGTGGIVMNAASGTLTIGSTGGLSAGTGATVQAGKFVNNANAGAGALGSRWTLYSVDPSLNTLNGLTANFIQYNATLGATLASAGNALVYSIAPTLQINSLTGSTSKVYDGGTTALLNGSNFASTGLLGGDAIVSATGTYASSDAASGINVTSPASMANFMLANNGVQVFGYTLIGSPVSAKIGQITPKQLTAQIVGNPTKVYDGTTTATLSSSNYEIDGFVGTQGATVKQPSSIAYGGSDAGTQAVNASFSVTNFTANSGTNLSNYLLPTTATGMGLITQAPLLVSGLLANNKVYDGTNADSIVTGGAKLFGVIAPDAGQVTLDTSGVVGAFQQTGVGNGLGVTLSGFALSGGKASNYQLIAPTNLTANITPKALTIDQVIANNKTYDNTTSATLNTGNAVLDGVVGSDNVTLNSAGANAAFGQTDAGTNLTVTSSGFALAGGAAGNYTLIQPTLLGNINPALLTIGMIGTPEKTYDGTNAVTLGSGNFSISGFIGNQNAVVSQSSASYATANAGSGITVTARLQPSDFTPDSGTSMSNYTFAPTVVGSNLGKIDPLQLSGLIVNNPSKVYDGTPVAALGASNLQLTGFIPGQSITANFSGTVAGTYDNPNAGARGVTAGVLPAADFAAGSGTLLSNYILPSIWTGSGSITPAPLTGAFVLNAGIVDASKVYDGTTGIILNSANFTLSGFVNNDSAVVNDGIHASFGQKDVGTNIPLSAQLAITDLTGTNGTTQQELSNYQIVNPVLGVGNITPRQLLVSIVGNPTKVYNGSTDVALNSSNFQITGWATGEGGSINPSATSGYDAPDAGARTVSAALTPGNYLVNSGTSLSNYSIASSAVGAGTINQAPLFITGIFATNRSYDTTTADSLNMANIGLAGLVDTDAGDASKVALNLSQVAANFTQANVGNGLTVNATGFQITGSESANYLLQPVNGLVANITRAVLTLSGVTANDKTYDGNTSASLNIAGNAALHGVFAGDTVGFDGSAAGGQFVTANAGNNLGVGVSGFALNGASSGNYQLTQPQGLAADINPKQLIATIIGSPTKVYDGTDSATLTAADYDLVGFVGSDGASIPQSATANYVTKNVGTGLGVVSTLVTSDFLANSGTNLTNYVLPTTGSGNNGIIQPKVINLTGTRVYDGTLVADGSLFGVLQGVNGETLGVAGSGSLATKNVGEQWSFTSLGSLALTNGGNGGLGSNYTLAGGIDWVTITPRQITASFLASDKTYDATVNDVLSGATLETANGNRGLIAGDDVSLNNTASGHFSDKNVGTGKTVTGDMSIGGNDAGNYVFTNGTSSATISALHITVSATGKDKVYDATTADAGATVQSAGVIGGDTVNFGFGSATFDDKNVASNKTVTVTGVNKTGADAGNYVVDNTTLTTTAAITPYVVNLNGTRVYDGTTTADASTFNGGVVNGVNGETLQLSGSFQLGIKDATTISWHNGLGMSLGNGSNGGLSSNYTLDGGFDVYDITQRSLTASFVANGKTYDGNTNAVLANALLEAANGNRGLIAGDDVTLTNATAGTFDNKNVGTNKTVTGNMGISGGDAGNYIFTNGSALADIGKRALSVGAAGATKVYDGTTNDPGLTYTSNAIAGDNLIISSTSIAFTDKNVGTGKTINVGGIAINGTDAGNYDLQNNSTTTTANITPYTIDLHASRVYDGNIDVASTLFGSSGLLNGVNGEQLLLVGDSSVADKKVANGKVFNGAGDMALDGVNGSLGSNYQIGSSTLDITPLAITGSITADNKVYDATAAAVTHGSLSGVLAGDTVGFDTSGTFSDKNVNNGKVVSLSSSLNGADAGNYTYTANTTTTANITPLAITVAATVADKVYDTTTGAFVTSLTSNGVLGSDAISFTAAAADFSDANAAGGKDVTVIGIAKSGTDANNYTINSTALTHAAITPVVLDLSGTRVYDGTTGADAGAFGANGVLTGIAGQTINLVGGGQVNDKNVGQNKLLTGLGTLALQDGGNGGLAQNYTLMGGNDSLTITPKGIDVTAAAANKVYDTTAGASVTSLSSSGLIGNDDVSFGFATSNFSDANAANGKTVTVTGLTASGGDAGNYTLNSTTATTFASITPYVLDLHGTRVYDGSLNADASQFGNNGVLDGLNGETLDLNGTGHVGDKNVGTSKTVVDLGTLALSNGGNGGLASNYLLAGGVDLFDITPKTVAVTATAANKVYDTTTGATVTSLSSADVLAGDTVNFGYGASNFADANAAHGKTVTVTGLTTSGADAGNYVLVGTTTTTQADITPYVLDLNGTRVYDATVNANAGLFGNNGVLSGLNGETVNLSGTGHVGNKNVGSNKVFADLGTLALADGSNGGLAGNYTLSGGSDLLSITPKALGAVAVANDRVYDGTTVVSLSGAGLVGLLHGDQVTLNNDTQGTLQDKNVGSGKAVTTDMTIAGADAGNYTFTTAAGLTANVTPKLIGVAATAANKVYDTTAGATVTSLGSAGVLAGDTVSFAYGSATFSDANAATGKTVTVVGLTAGGADAGNYALSSTSTSTQANITPYVLSLTGTRVYDGTVAADAGLFGHDGVLSGLQGQTVNLSGAGHVGDKNVGNHKAFADLGSLALADGDNGGLASNYTLAGGTDVLSITPMAITVTATGSNKMFDGSTRDQVILGSGGVLPGDTLQFADGAANFQNPNVGDGKPVMVTGIQLSGADAANYTLTSTTAMTDADITGARPSAFGIGDGVLAQQQSVLGPSELATPYGLADQDTVGAHTGNKKRQHEPLERNRSRDDFTSGMALRVVDGGVRMPVQALP